MDIPYGNRGFNDRYLLYKKILTEGNFESHSPSPCGRFRGRDVISYAKAEGNLNSNTYVDNTSLTIQTPSKLDFVYGDFVYNVKTKEWWRISNIVIDDDGQMKELSNRPRQLVTLTLSGGVADED